jgi:ADP-ribose pyrophosphatase
MTTADAGDDLSFPELQLELLEDLSPGGGGFLRLVRRRLVVRYPDGTQSAPFVYDEADRRAIDAVVIAAYFRDQGRPWVYLRSAMRPPVRFRDPRRSPVPESQTGALWELPAGLIEPEEQSSAGVLRAAQRELEEELGFTSALEHFSALGPATFPCPGVIAERHFFVAVEVVPAARREPSLDGSALERFGRVLALPLERALALCHSGGIEDAKTELGLRRLEDALKAGVSPAAFAPGSRQAAR